MAQGLLRFSPEIVPVMALVITYRLLTPHLQWFLASFVAWCCTPNATTSDEDREVLEMRMISEMRDTNAMRAILAMMNRGMLSGLSRQAIIEMRMATGTREQFDTLDILFIRETDEVDLAITPRRRRHAHRCCACSYPEQCTGNNTCDELQKHHQEWADRTYEELFNGGLDCFDLFCAADFEQNFVVQGCTCCICNLN